MKAIKARWIFLVSLLLGTSAVLGNAAYGQWEKSKVPVARLTQDIAVTEQISLNSMPVLRGRGYATIIDLRPDGEAPDQPASREVEAAAIENGIKFHYIPVTHGEIPVGAVNALQSALADSPRPILMYCRSGSRAARTWSLVEASRAGGMDEAAILKAVKSAGLSAEDLSPAIGQRISNRVSSAGQQP
jgi:uncharacterized protein (TIGR01244 family)